MPKSGLGRNQPRGFIFIQPSSSIKIASKLPILTPTPRLRKFDDHKAKLSHSNSFESEIPIFLTGQSHQEFSDSNIALHDSGFGGCFLIEPKCDPDGENLLSDIDWISTWELKDIEQILSF